MIAMALACNNSKLLIADEPTTALDVTTQAQILRLFRELQEKIHMSIMLITHDLGVIAEMADRVLVMYLGRIVEKANVTSLFKNPLHPYTRGLLESLPNYTKDQKKSPLATIPGTVPNALNLPSGCKFYNRCSFAKEDLCNRKEPELIEQDSGHWVRCANMDEVLKQ
jgi:oligopeptide/dipeptide ABC transporter ATP-binding protein